MSVLDPARWELVRSVLEEALDLPPAGRAAFVDRACAGDAELRAEVLVLIAADAAASRAERTGDILAGTADAYASIMLAEEDEDAAAPESGPAREGLRARHDRRVRQHAAPGDFGPPTKSAATSESNSSVALGQTIGTYRIVGRLGEGGMGIVYEAEQENPRRRVALKIVRGGPFVDEVRLRLFRREAQALARLKHPGIAVIHEAGRTEHGQHWIAMELVRGAPLDRGWAAGDATAFPAPDRGEIRRRLALLLQVCEVVGYAHQRGVIHRDLKPSNILIVAAEAGGAGSSDPAPGTEGQGANESRVKILDFGLARIIDDDVDASMAHTEARGIHGTLPYMSPEQARGASGEVDTRADLYAIGVLLYQAITGALPHDLDRLSLPRALHVICEETPPRPRSRNAAVPADLEAIALKAIEKDPARRYASVGALGDDLRRFLADLPVHARPPSALYQLRKLARRHRAVAILGAGLFFAVVLGAAGTTVGLVRARRAAAEARTEAQTAEQVSRFLVDLFRVSDPGEARGNSITARELLDQGAARIEESLRDQPLVQGRLLGTIGDVYRKLGLYREARAPLERALALRRQALGAAHPDVARDEYALAGLLRRLGEFDAAREHYERALKIREAAYGPEHTEVAVSLTGLANVMLELAQYPEARPLYERAIRIVERNAGPEDPSLSAHLYNLSLLLQRIGDSAGALPLLQRLVALNEKTLGTDHPEVAADLASLARTHQELGDTTQARVCLERALHIQEKALGPDHMDLAETWSGLGSLHLARQDGPAAVRAFESSYRIMTRALGDEHPTTAMIQSNLADALRISGRLAEAVPLAQQSLSTLEAAVGPDHPYTATTLDRQAALYADAGHLPRARASYERALRIRVGALGMESPLTAETLWGLAGVVERLGDAATGRAMFASALRARRACGPGADSLWLRRFDEFAQGLRKDGQADSAAVFEIAVADWRRGNAPASLR